MDNKQIGPELRKQIGRRLVLLREELAGPGEDAWTQGRLAEESGLSRNVVARLEQSFSGGVDVCLTIINFYYQRGYNVNWLLIPDNSTVSKLALSDATKSVDAQLVQRKLEEFRQTIDNEVITLSSCLLG